MYKNILVPVAPDHNVHAGEAMEVARLLCDEGGKITALTVAEAIPSYVEAQLPEGLRDETAKALMANLKADLGAAPDVHPVVVSGHSANTILDYAEQQGVDCIVIASHRPGLQDLFLGSTAARVVRHATCAVHVIR